MSVRISIVCFVSGDGGVPSKTFDLASALRRAGCGVQTVFLGKMPTHPYITPGDIGAVHIRGKGPLPVVRAVRAFGPDLVIARYFTYSGIPAALSGRLLDVPSFATVHGAGVRFHTRSALVRSPMRLVARTILNRYDRVFPVSEELRGDLLDLGISRSRIVLAPNGVDHERYRPARAPSGGRLDIMFAGSLYPEKRLDVLFDALRILEKGGVSPSVEIIGDGPSRGRWEKAARGLLRVRFRGWVEDMADEYPRARVFVLSSDIEGSPNALLEAMACGLPAAATAVGGIPNVLEDGRNGLLVAPGDPDALARALKRLLGDGALRKRLGAAARKTVVEGHTWDDVGHTILSEFEKLSGGAAR